MTLTTLLRQLATQNIKLWVEGEQLRIQAPKGVMTPTLRDQITAQKSELLAWLQGHQQESADLLPPLVPQPDARHQSFPLTDVQHAYWIGRSGALQLGNVSTHSYIELAYTTLDVGRLEWALNQLIARHEMLRAVVLPTGEQQILAEVPYFTIPLLDLRGCTPALQAEELAAIRQTLSQQVLPLDCAPLFDIRVTQLSDTHFVLHQSIDIFMFDVGSLAIILAEWRTLYEEPAAILPPIDLSFRDYVLAEAALKTTPLYDRARAYWLQRIDTLPPGPELPLLPTTTVTEQTFVRRSYQLGATPWQALKAKAQQLGISPSVLILTAFATVLKSWSKQPRFTLNLTLFNRLPFHAAVNQVVGDFTALTLVEVDYTTPLSLAEQSSRLQHQLWEALEQRYFNGIEVMREVVRRRNDPQAGALPVVFTSAIGVGHESGRAVFNFLGGDLRTAVTQTPQVWLDHQLWEYDDGLLLNWDSVDALFPPNVLDEMFTAYGELLAALASNEQLWDDAHYPLLPATQAAQYAAVNATSAPITGELLHTLFLKQVAPHAADPAVITPAKTLTYQELYDRANQIAHWLRTQGIGQTPGVTPLVAVVMAKGWEQVVAVLAIHLAGGAYLPIDPTLPAERQHYLLQQGEAVFALTQEALAGKLSWPTHVQWLAVDRLAGDATLPPLPIVQAPTDLAYVIYTSGSTGLPKGVVIDHRGAVNTVLDINQRFGVTSQDRVLALSALNFDLSVYDIFGLLAVGGALVMPNADERTDPAHWLELMHRHQVTLWDTVPALMQMLVEHSEPAHHAYPNGSNGIAASAHPAADLRLVMMSGDWIPVTLPDRIKALWPTCEVYSLGGATEASIWSIYYPITYVDPAWASIPYGKPMVNQSFHVLDAGLNPRPHWVPGDLYIGGIGLALGYWKDEQKSNERFIIHPRTGERLYKTGDLGRYLPDGNIEFLGREDFQVKIRGHRIELGEIESTLLQHPAIKEAVVNAVGDPKGNRQLVAYVVRQGEMAKPAATTGATTMPDHYGVEEALGATAPDLLTDPVARLEFKLRQPGVRYLNGDSDAVIPLAAPAFAAAQREAWLSRQSYRTFSDAPISFAVFSDFLRCLVQMPVAGAPLPKYRYPSAGSLYPVQTYLYVKPGRIEGLAGGFYYHHPQQHGLLPLSPDHATDPALYIGVNRPIFDQAAFALFLVADLNAIAPMYGPLARDFALLEAGHMSQLLMTEAPHYQLGLCPTGGGFDRATVHWALALSDAHQILPLTLLGGRIEPSQCTQWLQPEQKAGSSTDTLPWQVQLQAYLQQKLPTYMVPSVYVAMDALPLTANGKVDRKALPTLELSKTAETLVAPTTELEKTISAILQEMLALDAVGIDHEFIELGLNSVHIVRFSNRLKERLQQSFPLATLFQYTTIRTLAHHLAQAEAADLAQDAEKLVAKSRRELRGQARLAERQRQRG